MKRFIMTMCVIMLIILNNTIASSEDQKVVLMFQVQKEATNDDLALLRSLGVNTIQSFNLSFWPNDDIKSYLAKAEKKSLRVVVSLNHFIWAQEGRIFVDELGLENFINTYKINKVIFAWHLIDEPSNNKIDKTTLRLLYKKIKTLDPGRPIMITWAGTNQEDYDCCFALDTFDILCIECYINNDITQAQYNLLKFVQRYNIEHKPVIIVLRTLEGSYPIKWLKMPADSLEKQYSYFFEQNKITQNIGFYGWELNPNIGISQNPEMKTQFIQFMKKHYQAK